MLEQGGKIWKAQQWETARHQYQPRLRMAVKCLSSLVKRRLKNSAVEKTAQEPRKSVSFFIILPLCRNIHRWWRFPGKTYIVQVGEFNFQGGEEGPGKWLHSHRDDSGVQNSAVPGKKGKKRCFKVTGRRWWIPTASLCKIESPIEFITVAQGLVYTVHRRLVPLLYNAFRDAWWWWNPSSALWDLPTGC